VNGRQPDARKEECTVPTETLGSRLHRAREARHLSQEDVAGVLGVSRVLVSHWERNQRRPSEQVIERLAAIYGVALGRLVDDSELDLDAPSLAELLYRDAEGGIDPRAQAGLGDFVSFLDSFANLADALNEPLEPLTQSPFGLRKGFTSKEDIRRKALEVRDWLHLGQGPVGDLPGLLDEIGISVYRTALGADLGSSVSGAFLRHPRLGMCVAVNIETTPGRQLFTVAHELAHALFHSAEESHLVSVWSRRDEKERFADIWASEFLVPLESLRRAAEFLGAKTVQEAEEVVHLQRHFGVSYGMTLLRLRQAGLLSEQRYEDLRRVSPVSMAVRLGYAVDPDEWGQDPSRWRLERFPRRFLRLLTRALREQRISPASAATLTSLTLDEIAELIAPPNNGDPEIAQELSEYESVRERVSG
jgi:Zn-dependent peptidase ImmA (M78 family)/DNA-binding XRE family transcriptional regulator